jgi:thymidylate kinase
MAINQNQGDPNSRSGSVKALGYFRRWLFPQGLFLVVLGPDGVGKSTTIRCLQLELQKVFGPCKAERWRPGLIRKVSPDTGNRIPHAKIPRGPVSSAFSLLGLALDFSIGYLVCAHPAIARSEAVIFDRYFHDLLIDPKRYRYAGPMWLPQLLSRAILPRRPIFIVLDADEELILSRKQELPLHELKRQRLAYKAFAARMPRSMIIRTDKPVDDIVSEIVVNIRAVTNFRNATAGSEGQRQDVSLASPSADSRSYR